MPTNVHLPAIAGPISQLSYTPGGHLQIIFRGGLTLTSVGVAESLWRSLKPQLQSPGTAFLPFLKEHCIDAFLQEALRPPGPFQAGEWQPVVARGLAELLRWLPANTHAWISELVLDRLPCVIHCLAARKSKHGDLLPRHYGPLSKMTVSISGNPYQQFLTTIHELAHNEVALRWPKKRLPPHGQEWQLAFQRLLVESLERQLFPADLIPYITRYAANPKATSSGDVALQTALRPHETHDKRPVVSELPLGQWFSLDGKLAFQKGPQLRTYFSCKTTDGRTYRVHATAKVSVIYRQGPEGK